MRTAVQRTYAAAATRPRPNLCCAQDYQSEWIAHIPAEAFTFNYGCGSPVMKSAIREGEQVLDLGSGVGIDCFVAAKIVGPSGRVTGVDMTDEMLERAEGYRTRVAATLGFDNLEFRKGFIESIPLPDASVDVIRLVPVDNSLIFTNFMNRLRAKRTDSLTNRFFLLSIRPV